MNLEPLWELRVTTPRLELRLPTDAELEELYGVAERGIHPPDQMPFFVPWTDDLTREGFLSFHRQAWTAWTPESWSCNLVTFLDGRVAGAALRLPTRAGRLALPDPRHARGRRAGAAVVRRVATEAILWR